MRVCSKQLANQILARALEHAVATSSPMSTFIVEPLIEYAHSVVTFSGPSLPTSFGQAMHLLLLALSILEHADEDNAGGSMPQRQHSGGSAALYRGCDPVGNAYNRRQSMFMERPRSAASSSSDVANSLAKRNAHRRSRSNVPARGSLDTRLVREPTCSSMQLPAEERERLAARAVRALATGLHMHNCVSEPLRLWRKVLASTLLDTRDEHAAETLEARAHVTALSLVKLFMLSEQGEEKLSRCADSSAGGDGVWRTTFGRGRPSRDGIYFQPVVPHDSSRERAQLQVCCCWFLCSLI